MIPAPETLTPAQRWERYWFHPVLPHLYAVLRVVFGSLAILDLLGTTPVDMFWDVDGIAPIPGLGNWGVRSWVAESGFAPVFARLFFFGTLTLYSCMTAGIGGQAAVVGSFLASVWHTAWNVLPLSAAHQVPTAVIFCLIWVDCGQVLTVWPALRKGTQPQPQSIAPLRLLQYQVCLIYLTSGVSKFSGPLWRDGTAVYYAFSHNVVQRFPVDVPPALEPVATLATYGTLVFELSFPVLVAWRRTRVATLIVGVLLHAGAWILLEIGPFSPMMIATYIAFVPPERVAALVDTIRERANRAISR